MDAGRARRELVRALQLAHSGEWGAIRAYLGHRAALPHGEDREAIRKILVDEIRHRRIVLAMLISLGGRPDRQAERKMNRVGRAISAFCLVGGWFLPMYGAARLEKDNIGEYEVAARLAFLAGHPEFVDDLLHLAEIEWDHESDLRTRAQSHWMWRLAPGWTPPEPRASIRSRFETFLRTPHPVRRRSSPLAR